MQNLKKNIIVLSLLSAILLSIPFIMPHCGWVALFGFIPLFAAQTIAENNKVKFFFLYYYSSFIIWNAITTFWIWFATPAGAIAAILLNALQMSVVFWLFTKMKRATKGFLPYLFFIFTWIAWEHAYYYCHISWPWLTLGNSFATSIRSIQWYEYTGALGGSFWILLVNTLLYRVITLRISKQRTVLSLTSAVLLIVVPFILSGVIWKINKPQENMDESRNVLILQPNIDPYNEKFGGLTQDEQNNILFNLYLNNVTPDTYLTLAPETFVSPSYTSPSLLETTPEINPTYRRFVNTLQRTNVNTGKESSVIFGAVTDKVYDQVGGDAPTETAREIKGRGWYDRYNTAVFIDGKNYMADFYHKSKLVILVESTPFKGLLKFLKKFEIDLGGMMGSFGVDPDAKVFAMPDSVKVGTAICYESIYGDYYRRYVLKGADFMTIITNDGWWRDTPGYRQHLSYASLRAIETRRSIARCANTGISAFINQRGEIVSRTEWWKDTTLSGNIEINHKTTVFVQLGDVIGRVSCFVFWLFMLMLLSRLISKKNIVYEN